MVGFPYYSHTIPISLGILMGMLWEAYHKGVPLLGVPENPTENRNDFGLDCKTTPTRNQALLRAKAEN